MILKIQTDLLNWSEKHDEIQKGSKALHIYVKCLNRGKKSLANKIKAKYGRRFPKSDLAISFMMALISKRNQKINKNENSRRNYNRNELDL